MRILMVMNIPKFGVEHVLRPLADCEFVDRIYLVRELEKVELDKTETYLVPKFMARHYWSRSNLFQRVVREFAMLVMMVILALRKKPDIIISHNVAHSPLAFIVGKLFGKPIIANIDNSPRAWKMWKRVLPLLKHFDAVCLTGTRNRDDIIKMGLEPDKVHIVPNSIDVDMFKPRPLSKIYDIINVGVLKLSKGSDTVLRIADKLCRQKNDTKVALVGNDTTGGYLKGLCDQLGLSANVSFLGYKPNNEVEHYLNSSKIFVLPSHSEGLPGAMLEAMACGLPCVVSNVGDITDIAQNEVNAFVIDDPNDVDGFTRAILRLLQDDELYARFSRNTQIVREKYNFGVATAAWRGILPMVVDITKDSRKK